MILRTGRSVEKGRFFHPGQAQDLPLQVFMRFVMGRGRSCTCPVGPAEQRGGDGIHIISCPHFGDYGTLYGYYLSSDLYYSLSARPAGRLSLSFTTVRASNSSSPGNISDKEYFGIFRGHLSVGDDREGVPEFFLIEKVLDR